MNTETFREYCLSLPGASEKMPFQAFKAARNILAFYIGGHMFCFYDIEKFDECTIKCHPEHIEELEESYQGITRPYNLNMKYWIGVHFGSDVPDAMIKDFVRQSYEIVKAKKK